MLNIHIEKVIDDDLEAINDISIDHWGDEGNYGFKRLKHLSDKGYSFCLKNNNEIVAFCIVDIDDDKCEIYLLAVKKGNEGKGYGTAIFGSQATEASNLWYKYNMREITDFIYLLYMLIQVIKLLFIYIRNLILK